MTWSADVVADDWKHINASEVVRRAHRPARRKGQGHPAAARHPAGDRAGAAGAAAPAQGKGYRIVQVVPGKGETPVPVAARPTPATAATAAATAAAAAPLKSGSPVAATPPPPCRWPSRVVAAGTPPCPNILTAPSQTHLAGAGSRKPAIAASAADSLARGDTSRTIRCGRSPRAQSLRATCRRPASSSPRKPGGWPPVISVPVPAAGGVGVSSVARQEQTPEGRFQ